MPLTVDHNIPMPVAGHLRKFFAAMKPGESVLIDMTGRHPGYGRKLANRMAGKYRFVSRTMDDGNVRIWCVK